MLDIDAKGGLGRSTMGWKIILRGGMDGVRGRESDGKGCEMASRRGSKQHSHILVDQGVGTVLIL